MPKLNKRSREIVTASLYVYPVAVAWEELSARLADGFSGHSWELAKGDRIALKIGKPGNASFLVTFDTALGVKTAHFKWVATPDLNGAPPEHIFMGAFARTLLSYREGTL
jgi:hypothetical protein